MFSRGSRYRGQKRAPQITAGGGSPLGAELRQIPPRSGSFSHRVRSRERLDLLAHRYYADSQRWWQIADANPSFPYPLDLVDRRPLLDEEIALTHPTYLAAVETLIGGLSGFDPTVPAVVTLAAVTLTIAYSLESERQTSVAEIQAAGFAIVSSFAWSNGAGTLEAFTFESRPVRRKWQELVARLCVLPGMLRVVPLGAPGRLSLTYNELLIDREKLNFECETRGFSIVNADSFRFERVGASLVIPPNRVS